MNIQFSPPDITDLEIAEVTAALKSGWITTGPKTKLFEKKIAEYCGTSMAVCLSSIRIGSIKGGGKGKRITIGVHHKEKGAFYANPLEFGHGGPAPAPAHPFVRPAFDTRSEDAYDEMKKVLRSALDHT